MLICFHGNEVGRFARLSDGQLVRIEIVHHDGYATVRRLEGEWAGTIAVCKVSQLLPETSLTKN
jgi:hypothetical protein